MPSTLLSLFSQVADPRRGQGKMYPLAPILLFTVLSMLAGARSYRQVQAFIRTHLERLNATFGVSLRRAPAYSSVRFILHGLDASEMERVFRAHAASLAASLADSAVQGAIIPAAVALDGKTLRGSFDAFHDRKAAHVLSAFAAGGQIILGHVAVAEKSNEIPAAQEMIASLGLQGRVFTLDAMHCQKTFAAACSTGNHLLVQLKANQATLFDAVYSLTAHSTPADAAFSRTIGRCRQEDRTVDVFPAGEALATTEWQPFVKTIVRVTRQTLCRAAATGLWEERGEVAFYVSSATELPASAWAVVIRGHWGIENRKHYVRDVSCGEDQSRIRSNPGIMARARSFALNILRKNSVTNVAHALWNGALSLDHILAYQAI